MLIYNLFPRLAGPYREWKKYIYKIKKMGFDWIYINPFHTMGYSKSLYSIKNHDTIDKIFCNKDEEPIENIKEFVTLCHQNDLKIMLDLVINHTAIDSHLNEKHLDWYLKQPDQSIVHPACYNDTLHRKIFWYDLAQLNYQDKKTTDELISYWKNYLKKLIAIGIDGFRCDAAYQIPPLVWKELIDYSKNLNPSLLFTAETLGCRLDETIATYHAGFDYIFNSVHWWDYQSSWFIDDFNATYQIPSIGFPESHDTLRVSKKNYNASENKNNSICQYLMAAFVSHGVMVPIGFEFGFQKALHVQETTPLDWEENTFNICCELTKINKLKNIFSFSGTLSTHNKGKLIVLKKENINQSSVLILNNSGEKINLSNFLKQNDYLFTHKIDSNDLKLSNIERDHEVRNNGITILVSHQH
ncbi:alpha-amylase family glycosyl hydrolase [Legionella worsleiensis]|uniref:Alpha-amylase n=1 Tax=Legionella worsleiensis TaxID=45076 RepID=A0A0W1AGC4_9GAMM|nr:alpha-amylase family glycosyl hydrolase [Legionella worsleiensis]KTD80224.1 alpha-amylase [Legionella worsleiensis]STY31697.1 alpha-amylase [Legionella worsleiensis]